MTDNEPNADLPELSEEEKLRKLEAFVLDDGLRKLEQGLGQFNLFTTLRLHEKEIIHSRILGWLLSPDGSHGVGDLFLRRWLMRVLHRAGPASGKRPSIIQIEAARWKSVEVFTEWRPRGSKDRLDVLLNMSTDAGAHWQVAVEMKISSNQSVGQLLKYQTALEKDFPDVTHRVLLFLTRDPEPPDEDTDFIGVDFEEMEKALGEILAERAERLGAGPRGLMENYLNLIRTWFMDKSEIAKQARDIYSKHRDALELLFQHRPDAIAKITDRLGKEIEAALSAAPVKANGTNRGHVYFVPVNWLHDVLNPRGKFIYCDIKLRSGKARLRVILDAPSADWPDLLSAASKAPFKRQGSAKSGGKWTTLHSEDLGIKIDNDDERNLDELADQIKAAVVAKWNGAECKKVVATIGNQISQRAAN